MVIYKITNLITGKIYIGQTKHSIERRFKQHCDKLSKSTYLNRSIAKYGVNNFKIQSVVKCNTEAELNHREKLCIRLYNTISPAGYNLTDGGHNGSHCEEVRKKISKAQTGKRKTAEQKAEISNRTKGSKNGMFGRKHSLETRAKISTKILSMNLVPQNKGQVGKFKHTEESRQKISNSLKGHTYNRGKTRSDEFKNICRINVTKRNQKKVINVETGEVLNTAKLLVDVLKMPYSTIINMLNGTNPNRTKWKYLL